MLRRERLVRTAPPQPSQPASELVPPLLPDGAGYRLAEAREADRNHREQVERRLRWKERRVARLERRAARCQQLTAGLALCVGLFVAGTMLHQWLLGRVSLGLDTIPVLLALPDVGPPLRIASRLSLVMSLGTSVLLAATVLARRCWRREVQALGWEPGRFAQEPGDDDPGTRQ